MKSIFPTLVTTHIWIIFIMSWAYSWKYVLLNCCQLFYMISTCNAVDPGLIPGSGRSPGESNGNPFGYSCLENPMDRGVCQATVHGVARVQQDLVTKPSPPFYMVLSQSDNLLSNLQIYHYAFMHQFTSILLKLKSLRTITTECLSHMRNT